MLLDLDVLSDCHLDDRDRCVSVCFAGVGRFLWMRFFSAMELLISRPLRQAGCLGSSSHRSASHLFSFSLLCPSVLLFLFSLYSVPPSLCFKKRPYTNPRRDAWVPLPTATPAIFSLSLLHEKQGCFGVQMAHVTYTLTSDYKAIWASNNPDFYWSVVKAFHDGFSFHFTLFLRPSVLKKDHTPIPGRMPGFLFPSPGRMPGFLFPSPGRMPGFLFPSPGIFPLSLYSVPPSFCFSFLFTLSLRPSVLKRTTLQSQARRLDSSPQSQAGCLGSSSHRSASHLFSFSFT